MFKPICDCDFREIELRENLVGKGFLDCPTAKTQRAAEGIRQAKLDQLINQKQETLHRVTVLGEIVSAVGF